MNYPPGPSSAIATYYRLYRDPLGLLAEMAREYGDIVHLQVGGRHDYLINHPDYIRAVLLAGEEQMLRSFPRPMKRVLGGGLLTSQGEYHLRQRRLIQPSFHSQFVASCGQAMSACSVAMMERWHDGEVVDIAEEMLKLTLAIVIRTLFNVDVAREANEIAEVLNVVMEMTHKNTMPFLDEFVAKLPLPNVRRYRQARRRLDAMVDAMIEQRRASELSGTDFLSTLLRMQEDLEDGSPGLTDEEVHDEAMTMFVAGHETMGSALAWTWYLLALHPHVGKKVHAEVDHVLRGEIARAEHVPRLSYTSMVLSEAMRLYPPVWLMARRPTRDFQLGKYVVPAKSYIHLSQFLMHRDSRYFPEAEKFDPMRWVPEIAAARPKFCYFPFGAGSRKCIGDGFAWMEALLVIATVAQHWTMGMDPGHPVELQPLITLRPKHGLKMIVQRRA